MKTNIYPIGDRVVIKIDEEDQKIGSIFLPDAAKDEKAQGTVIAVSDKEEDQSIMVGDRVIFGKYSGDELKIDGENLRIVKEEDILAIIDVDA